ncbi:hypothetical protein [Mesobacillus subterraneus]|uniref:hypothetical protein n=1 Tax=Mesobacillus subterraneus TaxID=285983 RepID=UPI001472F0BD|nr:hypothetical protein [Mesobacillus subterraneus]
MDRHEREQQTQVRNDEQEHSMVCNDQLFFAELRIAAEESEKDRLSNENSTK